MYFLIILPCFVHLLHGAPLEKILVDMTYVYNDNFPYVKELVTPFQMSVVQNGSYPTSPWVQIEEITMATHLGTHVDAPAHFTKGGITVDEIPVSKFIAPAAVINITERAIEDHEAVLTVEDLENWESLSGQTLNGTIVLVNSGWGKKWPNREEFLGTAGDDITQLRYPGISPEAAQWLVDNRNINGIGVDTISLDKGSALHYPSHNIILNSGLFGIENVANMDEIPIYGATLYVMPMKIGRGSGAPARIVATFPKVNAAGQCSGPATRYSEENNI